MKVWLEKDVQSLTTSVFVQTKRVIYKTVYDRDEMKLKEELIYCYCPACKHLAGCSIGQLWHCKQLGRCSDFETE